MRMIAGSVADNVGLSARQLQLIRAEKCADCRSDVFWLQAVTGIQLGQGRDPVEVGARKKSAGVPPDASVRMLQVFPGTPQHRAPERRFGRTGAVDEIKHGSVGESLCGVKRPADGAVEFLTSEIQLLLSVPLRAWLTAF